MPDQYPQPSKSYVLSPTITTAASGKAAKRYYEQFGFVCLPSDQLQLFLPVKTIQQALARKS